MAFLKRAVQDTERVYDLTIGDKLVPPEKRKKELVGNKENELEESLFELGLVEEGSASPTARF